jgi:glycosyltransferase involved in cell wall biosynthesis
MSRVLFVTNVAGFFVSHRLSVARAAREAGYDVQVATPPGPGEELIREAGLPFHPLHLRRGRRGALHELRSLLDLAVLFERLKPDLVHLATAKAVILGGMAARLTGVRAVLHAVTGLGHLFTPEASSPYMQALRAGVLQGYRVAFRHPNCRVVFQNREDQDELARGGVCPPSLARLIPGTGIDPNRFSPSPEPPGTPIILFASRLVHSKGVRELAAAARLLKSLGKSARVVLVGDIDADNPAPVDPQELAGWVREGLVEHWGRRDEMPEVFRQAHIVTLPTYREGLPRVLLEAGACGRALVAGDVEGCRAFVQDGVQGLLVPPRDPAALAAALARLLDDPALRARLGAAARARVLAEFTEEAVNGRFLDLYRELLKG